MAIYRGVRRRTILLGMAAGVLGGPSIMDAAGAASGISRESFTLIMIPDTQIAVQDWPEFFYAQTQWIADNRNTLGIRFAIHVGDITEWPRSTDWSRARYGMNKLDGKVPYVVAIGNHDFDAWNGSYSAIAANRTCNNFNSYFPRSKFAAWPSFGSSYPSTLNDNSFHKFTAGGTDWGILTLKFNPTDAELAWGASVVAANPDRQIIINTHDCMNGTTLSATGTRLWNTISRVYPNVALILNGHYTNQGYRKDLGDNGNIVHHVMADYQDYDYADRYQNSFLRIMTFHPSTGTVDVRTYSPYLNQYKTDARNQFVITDMPFAPGAPRCRRHVISGSSLTAWRWKFGEEWLMPQSEVDAYPLGTPLPQAPLLIQATGDPAVYLADGDRKRHVPNQQVMAAWRWTFGDVQQRTPAQVAAMPTGPKVVDYPYLIRSSSGAAIYLMDDPN